VAAEPATEEAEVNLFDLSGKVAIVTGGNGGIGLGIAQGLAQAGASIAVLGRNTDKSETAARQLREGTGAKALVVTADVSREEEVARAAAETLAHFGRIDILFNNAGINIRKQPQDLSLDDWDQVLRVNLTSAFLMSKAVYASMKRAGGGKIINIGSMTSILGAPFAAAYASTKGGIVQLTKSLALAWAADNIQVNAILPGWFDTELTEKAREQIPGLHERVLARIAVGRWAKPADMAGTAIWLAGRGSDYITGVAIPVDGGYTAML
jgi:2-deoxy-D-gluconate 3-dehydrogenase